MLTRIMMIDDSEDDALVMRLAFRHAGLTEPIYHISDTDVAIAYLSGEGEYADRAKYPLPSVLLLDLKMPQTDGLHLLKWIRSQLHLARVFVVLLTSSHDTKVIQLGYQLGANSYLSKDAAQEEVRNFVAFFRNFAQVWELLPHEGESGRARKESGEQSA